IKLCNFTGTRQHLLNYQFCSYSQSDLITSHPPTECCLFYATREPQNTVTEHLTTGTMFITCKTPAVKVKTDSSYFKRILVPSFFPQ
uniref:Uncharacterized protein n=1 Tax=Cyanoderma ruficeps TaxID=181631 RepID=A0A8C3R662_9PASS